MPRTAALGRRVYALAAGRAAAPLPSEAELSARAFDAVLRGADPESGCAAHRAALAAHRAGLVAALRDGDYRLVSEAALRCTGRRLGRQALETLALDALVKAFDADAEFVSAAGLSALRAEIHGTLDEDAQARGRVVEHRGERIALIVLPSFYLQSGGRSATRDVRFIAGQLVNDGATLVVLDLRGNGGGVIAEARRLAAAFGCASPLGYLDRPEGAREVLAVASDATPYTGPLAVLAGRTAQA